MERKRKTPAQIATEAGLNGLVDVVKYTQTSRQTLYNWRTHKPELFRTVILGSLTRKQLDEKE